MDINYQVNVSSFNVIPYNNQITNIVVLFLIYLRYFFSILQKTIEIKKKDLLDTNKKFPIRNVIANIKVKVNTSDPFGQNRVHTVSYRIELICIGTILLFTISVRTGQAGEVTTFYA